MRAMGMQVICGGHLFLFSLADRIPPSRWKKNTYTALRCARMFLLGSSGGSVGAIDYHDQDFMDRSWRVDGTCTTIHHTSLGEASISIWSKSKEQQTQPAKKVHCLHMMGFVLLPCWAWSTKLQTVATRRFARLTPITPDRPKGSAPCKNGQRKRIHIYSKTREGWEGLKSLGNYVEVGVPNRHLEVNVCLQDARRRSYVAA